MLDISIIGIYYLIFGIISALFINYIIHLIQGYYERHKKEKNNLYYYIKLFLRTSMIMISAYIIRNIVARIPFIFDGIRGYKHKRVKEISGGVIIAFSIIALQNGYKKDINTLADRYKKKYPNTYFHLEL